MLKPPPLENFALGMLTSILTQPFEVIRTSNIIKYKHLNKLRDLMQKIHQVDGPKGFYRGAFFTTSKAAIGSGIFFTQLERFHSKTLKLRKNPNIPNYLIDFLNAGIARAMLTILVNPIHVLKTKFEVVGQKRYKGIWQSIKEIGGREGFRGFYRGMSFTRDFAQSGLQYASYKFVAETYKATYGKLPRDDQPMLVPLIGSVTGVGAVMVTYPLDNLRVRAMAHDLSTYEFSTAVKLVWDVWDQEGIRGYYIGILPRIIKKGVVISLSWTLYEAIKLGQGIHEE